MLKDCLAFKRLEFRVLTFKVISLKNTNVNKLVYRRPVLESKTAKSAKTEKCLFDCYLQSNFTIYYPDGSVKAWSMNIAAPTCTEAGQIIDAVK